MRCSAILTALLVVAALPAELRSQEVDIRVTCDHDEVDFGLAFSLRVVRRWSIELVPDVWTDESLTPLVVESVETSRRENGSAVEETRNYRCRTFRSGEILVPSIIFKARPLSDGLERVAISDELRLRVRSSLDPNAPGPGRDAGRSPRGA